MSEQILAHEQLVGSTIEALSLILSLVTYSPSRLPQFSNLSMTDGSLQDQQGPQGATSILVGPTACNVPYSRFTLSLRLHS